MPKTLREFSSGGVVFKKEKAKILWFIRRTVASELYPKQYWTLPKGWIDDAGKNTPGIVASGKRKATEDELIETAIREVKEEGGIKAKIIKKIGSEKYFYNAPDKGNILKFVTFYLMEWEHDLPEGHDEETSEIAWLDYKDARKTLSFGGEKQILDKASKLLS